MTLTVREQSVIDFIKQFSAEHRRAPYHREIMKKFGLTSRSYVGRLLRTMEHKGAIAIAPFQAGGISVVERPAFIAPDVWGVVTKVAAAHNVGPRTIIAEWVRERAEHEGRVIKWSAGGRRQTKEDREEILRAFLVDESAGTNLAISKGLAPSYAARLARERGLRPRKWEAA